MISKARALAHRLTRGARLRRNLGTRRRHPVRDAKAPRRRDDEAVDRAWLAETAAQWRRRVAAAPPSGPWVTAVCVSNRPHRLPAVVDNVGRQRYGNVRFVFVPNSYGFDVDALAELSTHDGVEVATGYEEASLGACLNVAIETAGTKYVAKFDDDDYYGADYLSHLVFGSQMSDAAVVGKHSCYGYLSASDLTVLRFPGHEWEYTTHLAGGTLLLDLDRIGDVRFPDVRLGEDVGFLEALERSGGLIFATDRFNYVQYRTGTNTWPRADERYIADSMVIGRGEQRDEVTGRQDAVLECHA